MRRVYRQIAQVAPLDIPVLIVGESGTGKELVARAIHAASRRSVGPFVALHTGSIARELTESELFGYEKGAFTGAASQSAGVFEAATSGTLLLDEIGTMHPRTQVDLLRVLETKRFRRVGGTSLITADVRVLAATNMNLRKAIRGGSFREDLYHRLNVLTITIPPLRDRPGDIACLLDHYLPVYARELGRRIKGIESEALEALQRYAWPGNVRELQNVLMRALVAATGERITLKDLPEDLAGDGARGRDVTIPVGLTLSQIERRYIERTLDAAGGNKTTAARMLGISRKALYNKIERHGIALGASSGC